MTSYFEGALSVFALAVPGSGLAFFVMVHVGLGLSFGPYWGGAPCVAYASVCPFSQARRKQAQASRGYSHEAERALKGKFLGSKVTLAGTGIK